MALTISTSDWTSANVRKTLSFPTFTDSKLVVQYDKTNEKIKTFTGSGNGNILAEVPNTSTLVNSKIFEFLVIGY